MKLFFFLFLLFSTFVIKSRGQSNLEVEKDNFSEYLNLFQNLEFPFHHFYTSRKCTEVDRKDIPEKLSTSFISNKGVPRTLSDCSVDSLFFGFTATGQFNVNPNYKMVLVLRAVEAGCDIQEFLISYSKNGSMIDYIPFYERLKLKIASDNEIESVAKRTEGSVYRDSILSEITILKEIRSGKDMIYNKNKTIVKHTISPEGKFIKEYEKEVK